MEFKGTLTITKEVIVSVHDYFRDKLIKGDFETGKNNQFHIDCIIDGDYRFTIWWANEDYGIRTCEDSFMNINLRVNDKKSIWSKIKKIKHEVVKKEIEKKEREALAILKKKYEELGKEAYDE